MRPQVGGAFAKRERNGKKLYEGTYCLLTGAF